MYSRFDTVHQCTCVTDGQTDRIATVTATTIRIYPSFSRNYVFTVGIRQITRLLVADEGMDASGKTD